MMCSMFAGVSGLCSHQTMMDVVGNNITKVNTAGFKSAQISFGEAMAQTLQGPAGAGLESGGTNPSRSADSPDEIAERIVEFRASVLVSAAQLRGASARVAPIHQR